MKHPESLWPWSCSLDDSVGNCCCLHTRGRININTGFQLYIRYLRMLFLCTERYTHTSSTNFSLHFMTAVHKIPNNAHHSLWSLHVAHVENLINGLSHIHKNSSCRLKSSQSTDQAIGWMT
jgi:hypothetical protein